MNKQNKKPICLIPFLLSLWATFTLFYILINISCMVLWIIVPTSVTLGFTIVLFLSIFGLLFFKARHKKQQRLEAAALGGISSIFFILLFIFILPFTRVKQLPNRQQHLRSPSGKYVLNVPVKRIKQKLLSFGDPYRIVTISDRNEEVIYQDKEETFPAWFGTYWVWDKQDRAWIYGSDAGICFYENINGNWIKHHLGDGMDITPPESLYPFDVRMRLKKSSRESNRKLYLINIGKPGRVREIYFANAV